MSQFVISLISIARMLVEIAGMSLIAQGVLFLFAGERRGENVVYQFFRIVTRPAILATRFFVPKRVVDRRIPFITFFLRHHVLGAQPGIQHGQQQKARSRNTCPSHDGLAGCEHGLC